MGNIFADVDRIPFDNLALTLGMILFSIFLNSLVVVSVLKLLRVPVKIINGLLGIIILGAIFSVFIYGEKLGLIG